MYAFNCNQKTYTTLEYTPSFYCVSLGLFTWQEVIDFLLDTRCIQQTSYD